MLSIKTLLTALFSLVITYSHAQYSFTPYNQDPELEKRLTIEIKQRYTNDVKRLEGSNKKYLQEIYKERQDHILSFFNNNKLLSAAECQFYLENVLQEVLKANPSFDKDIRIVFTREAEANAFSTGEGTIFFNIGLFHRLETESQFAFIISHELAHYYLNHSNNNIRDYVNYIYSPEFQQSLKEIRKSEYQVNSKIENLAKTLLFKNRKHNRLFEHAADSMALELLKNTNYNLNAAVTALDLLDSADQKKYSLYKPIDQFFHYSEYPFRKRWLENDALIMIANKNEIEKAEEDSLKTHPDCKKRIASILGKVEEYNKPGAKEYIVSETIFHKLKKQFEFEVVDYYFKNNNLSFALFQALQLLTLHPDNLYLNTMVGKCLNGIYIHQKKHLLSKVVDLPNNEIDKDYNNILVLIQNLRLSEIAGLSYHHLKQFESMFNTDPGFQETYNTSKTHFFNQ